jgi:hypothetical protein
MGNLEQIPEHYPKQPPAITHWKMSPHQHASLRKELASSSFAHPNAPQWLDACTHITTLAYEGRCTIHVVTSPQDRLPRPLLVRAAKRIRCLSDMFGLSRTTFWLVPVDAPRIFPQGATKIQAEHINGGYTYRSGQDVYILRREEFPKVMLHETIHHTMMDPGAFRHPEKAALQRAFQLAPTSRFEPEEAIVETWADLFHIAFLAHEYALPFQDLMEKEVRWSVIQAKRVLQHQARHFPLWTEGTNAYSYIVFRAVLLASWKELLATPMPMTTHTWVRWIVNGFLHPSFQKRLAAARIPSHRCFRMTVFGNL